MTPALRKVLAQRGIGLMPESGDELIEAALRLHSQVGSLHFEKPHRELRNGVSLLERRGWDDH